MKRIWINKDHCLGCRSCELACAVERDSLSRLLLEAAGEEPLPKPRVHVIGDIYGAIPLQCRQCADAPCLSACPAGALQRDEESGNIYTVADKCCGCYMCVMSCPFGAILPRNGSKAVMKCDGCYVMESPACVRACPTGALIYGDTEELEAAQNGKRADVYTTIASVGTDPAPVHFEYIRGN